MKLLKKAAFVLLTGIRCAICAFFGVPPKMLDLLWAQWLTLKAVRSVGRLLTGQHAIQEGVSRLWRR